MLTASAWSLPVIAVAVASPAAAASTGAVGEVWIETIQGGTWVDPQYYGVYIQIRNNDTNATVLPVEPITSATVTFTLDRAVVGPIQPAIIGNAGGDSPTSPALPATSPGWVSAGAAASGTDQVTYTLTYAGSIPGQGLVGVSFAIRGPDGGLVSPISYTATATGSPTDGHVDTAAGTLY